jgi:hypothetical protein
VSEVVQMALRLLGLLLLVLSAACLVLLLTPGAHAAKLLWTGFWVCLIAGFALRLITRRNGNGPLVIDLRRRPPV